MRKIIFSAVLISAGCGIHRLDWIQAGPEFPPKKYTDVSIYRTKEEPGRPWGAVGIIHGPHVPVSDRGEISRQMKEARMLAADHGADGIIIIEEPVSIRDGEFASDSGDENKVFLAGVAISFNVEISSR